MNTTATPPTELEFYVNKISDWISSIVELPQWDDVLITERLVLEPDVKVTLNRSQIWTVGEYKEAFSELVTKGYVWVNLSACGVLGGKLILDIDWPSYGPGEAPVASVNLSGPATWIQDRNCSLSDLLCIE